MLHGFDQMHSCSIAVSAERLDTAEVGQMAGDCHVDNVTCTAEWHLHPQRAAVAAT